MSRLQDLIQGAKESFGASAVFWVSPTEVILTKFHCEETDMTGSGQVNLWVKELDGMRLTFSLRAMGTYWSQVKGRTITATFQIAE